MKPLKVKYPQFFRFAKNKKSNLEEYTDSPMDRIAKYIDEQVGRKHYTYFDEDKNKLEDFDYRMLMNNEVGTDKKPLYEVDRSDNRYIELYNLLNRRKKKKQMICRNIQKEQGRHNVDAVEVTAKYDVFHYHCIREIKKIFTDTKGYFNVKLAVNYLVDMEYNKHEFVTTSKDILWKCFGHIIIDNINRNLETGITVKERPRMSYNKAMKGEAEIDNKISEQMRKSVGITQADIDFMDEVLQTKKNGTYYNNDVELLFALLCHYKYNKLNNKLKDEYLQITKKKHTTIKQNGRKKKVPIRYNMNAIMNMVGAKSYINSFKRFAESKLVQIKDDKLIRIKMDIEYTDKDEELFTVDDIYNPYVYLVAYQTGDPLVKCVICGKDFIKESNNQKTCSKKCSDELHKFRVEENNEKNRPAATQTKKEI